MKKRKNYLEMKPLRYTLSAVIVCMALMGIVVLYGLSGLNYKETSRKTTLDTGWMIYYDGVNYTDVDLRTFRTSHVMNEGDAIILYNYIPKQWDYDTPVLRIYANNSLVSVTIDGESKYRYGQERYIHHKNVGSGYHYIGLTDSDKGKVVRIVLMATEYAAFSQIDEIIVADYANTFKQQMTEYRIPYVAGNFLVVFGIAMMGVAGILMFKRWEMARLYWIGLLSLCVGGWTVCHYQLVQMYSIPLGYCSFLEYLSLYAGVLPAMMYFKGYVRQLNHKLMTVLFYAITGTEAAYTLVMVGLHALDLVHLPSGLLAVHIYMVIVFIYISVLMVMTIRAGHVSGKALSAGFFILLLSIIMDVVSFLIYKYTGNYSFNNVGFSAVGAITFVVFLLINFGIEIADRLKVATEKEVLYRMAYTDSLTKVHNRRYCEELLGRLSIAEVPFGIYSFDLNDLKKVNDTLGHACGDALISGFADILQQTFDADGICVGRMGGDEFIVIVEHSELYDLDGTEKKLQENIAAANERESRFQYSAAYGYADSRETDTQSVYTLADNRMYECKRKYKTPR